MLHPTIRRSPYFERTLAHGACDFMVYNHTYMPMGYGRDPRDDYRALIERVTLWDVGAERQCELRGPGSLVLADHLAPRLQPVFETTASTPAIRICAQRCRPTRATSPSASPASTSDARGP